MPETKSMPYYLYFSGQTPKFINQPQPPCIKQKTKGQTNLSIVMKTTSSLIMVATRLRSQLSRARKYVPWGIERNKLANLGSRPFLGLIHRDQSRITTVSDGDRRVWITTWTSARMRLGLRTPWLPFTCCTLGSRLKSAEPRYESTLLVHRKVLYLLHHERPYRSPGLGELAT